MPCSCDILLFGTMGTIGPVVRDDFEKHGLDVMLVDFAQNTQRDEFGYRRLLGKVLKEVRPLMIIPIGHCLTLAKMKQEGVGCLNDIIIPVETPEKIQLMDSKTRCSRFVSKLDVPQPRIYSLEEALSYEEFKNTPILNLIFKREKSFGGSGVYRPKNLQSLKNLAEHEPGNDFLIQDYIEGKDISVDCLRWKGEFFSSCYETLQKEQGQGPSTQRKATDCEKVKALAATILSALDYSGICGMDFRLDNAGNPYFLECNPRFCGGIKTQIESGFDLPYLLYKAASKA